MILFFNANLQKYYECLYLQLTDNAVFVENSRAAYRALKKIGKTPRYIEFPGCGHNSWDPAFNQPDFLEWLFRQSKQDEYIKWGD